jgi:formylglycine-generating enzyme required for sulfatase activity
VKCSGIISTFLLFFLTSESFAQDYTATVLDNIRSDYEMVYVSGGTFLMGDLFFQFNQESLPVHRVQVHDFYIGKYHVTFDQYDSFAKLKNLPIPDDRRFGRGSRAVVNVTWDEALAFCRALGYRLPTETDLRIIRGGSVKQLPFPIRTYWRTKTLHYNRGNDIGFRCASLGKTQK